MTAGESAGIVRLRDFDGVRATAGERSGVIGLLEVTDSDFPSLSNSVDSRLGLSTSACARASRVARADAPDGVCLGSSSSAESAAVVHAHATTLHRARNSGGIGGLLPVQRSTSYRLDECSQGPTRRKGTKGGGSGLAEDLRPVSEVETGVLFRLVSRAATRTRFWECWNTFPPTGGS